MGAFKILSFSVGASKGVVSEQLKMKSKRRDGRIAST